MHTLELWTDGANGGKNGTPGGWAAALVSAEGTTLAISGSEAATSNNRMELMAVIEGLKAVGERRAQVTIYTDSAYVKNPHTHGWLKRWQANGWRTREGDAVANQDLWQQLVVLVEKHTIQWVKVKGHTKKQSLNTVVDAMAVKAKVTQQGVTELL